MSPCGGAGDDVADPHVDRLLAEQGQQPADRPREADLAGAPAHRGRKFQAQNQLAQQVGQHVGRRPAGFVAARIDVGAASLIRLQHQLLNGYALAAREAFGRPGWLAGGVERGARRRALDQNGAVRLTQRQVVHHESEAPRRAQDARPAVLQALPFKGPVRFLLQLPKRRRAEPSGQFFNPDLEQQIRHLYQALPSVAAASAARP